MGAALLLGAVLAGCGGGSHGSRSATTGTVGTTTPAGATATTTGATGSATTGTVTTTAASGTGTATTGAATAPSGGGTQRHRPRSAATFVIGPHDHLAHPLIIVPSGTDVMVTLVSGDGHAHRALVRTTPPHTVRVPAGGRARILLTGLADGNYVIDLDNGLANGTVAVGNSPIP